MKGGVNIGSVKEDNVEIGPPVSRGREVKELVKEAWGKIDEIYIEEDWDNDNDGVSDEDGNVSMIDDVGASDEDDVSGWEVIILIEVCIKTIDTDLSKLVEEDWGSDNRDGKEESGLVAKADVRDNDGVGSGVGFKMEDVSDCE